MARQGWSFVAATLLGVADAAAVDAVTGASPPSRPAGTAEVDIWITGRGFAPGATVSISGGGVSEVEAPTVVPEAQRVDGGRGDGLRWTISVAADAQQGPRDVTVLGPDGTMATGRGIFSIGAAAPAPPTQAPTAAPTQAPSAPGSGAPSAPEPPAPTGVDVVTRASPGYGAQGEQVNLWIVGRTFVDGARVEFSQAGLGPAQAEGVGELPLKIVRNVPAENGKSDGIQYYLQIGQDTPVGRVDITVIGPDGSRATGAGLFEVVAPGAVPPDPGMGNVDVVTGASPPAFRAGRDVSLWVWGRGIATGAQLEFSRPGITPYAPYEAVAQAGNYPGFDGLRAFLLVEANVPAGPVDVTVVNPNGTRATGAGLLTVVAPGEPLPGAGEAVEEVGTCLPPETTVEEITRVVPKQVLPGSPLPLAIFGRGFACGASVLIAGGGLQASAGTAPRITRSVEDPMATTLRWDLEVLPDARLGPRDVTVVNPNNSSKRVVGAFEVVEVITETGLDAGVDRVDTRNGGVRACSARPGGASSEAWGLTVALAGLVAVRSRRRPARRRA